MDAAPEQSPQPTPPAAPAPRAQDDTPAMRQYRAFKNQYPDCILFFRMGDFYEMFYDDAKLAHKVLGVTLTQRTQGIPMAGVPYHSAEGYLRRMIQAGHRVAVCEQMEDPAAAKGVIRREVSRVITPGTLTDESLLEEGRENPLAAVCFHAGSDRSAPPEASVAWAELSTGSFFVATFAGEQLADELARIAPRELLYVETADGRPPSRVRDIVQSLSISLAARPGWHFRQAEAVEALCKQFRVASLAGYGFADDDPALAPASAIVHYLLETQSPGLSHETRGPVKSGLANSPMVDAPGAAPRIAHLQPPRRFSRSQFLVIDQTSLRSLEVERTIRSGGAEGSLLSALQCCVTPMGKRTLRHWLCYPLCSRQAIEARQRVVAALVNDPRFLDELRSALDGIQDVQRILARIAVARATPRDLVALGTSATQATQLATILSQRPSVSDAHARIDAVAQALATLASQITAACVEAPPHHLREGGLIRDGFDAQLDESRLLQRDSHSWLADYQKQLIEETAIPSLKVGYNKIFGYYIELTASQREKAPPAWSRKQTLKNAERFITPQLKEFEGKVLSAEQRSLAREQEIFAHLCALAQAQVANLQLFAEVAAELDVLAGFALQATRRRYVQPVIVDEPVLHVRGGRHPVLDQVLEDRFVPNDVTLGRPPASAESPAPDVADPAATAPTLALITGPNMAGKSTYIRQAALITLMAHTGSFVPAESAIVGLCDRLFTRIGASDELHAGQSTFMVEMTETANICHHASGGAPGAPGSLVILDEIGRGTSTLDGLSLAWSIAEHLAMRGCRTLFATHYHEITSLSQQFANVTNLSVSVREWQDQIVFLHRIVPGAADRSYGIHVAKIAGLPESVIDRANLLMSQLEVSQNTHAADALKSAPPPEPAGTRRGRRKDPQMSLFTEYLEHPAMEVLRKADVNQLTPMQAFDLLRKMRERLDQAT